MRIPFLAVVLGLLAPPALAQATQTDTQTGTQTGTQIAALIPGTTVEGSMADGVAYAEFYDADGTVRAEGYTATWTIEGDAMCFDYGEGSATCYGISLDGDALEWTRDGVLAGTGTVVKGNPAGF